MKMFFISLVLAQSAFACQIPEAQVIGTITKSEAANSACDLEVQLTRVAQHVFCPLRVRVGQLVPVSVEPNMDGRCPAAGEEISGVLQGKGVGYNLDR